MFFHTRHDMIKGLAVGRKTAVEVGVREGFLSRFVLEETRLELWGVDVQLLPSALALAGEFPGRYHLCQGTSPGYAANFPDGHFGLVHVDADHSREAVLADLAAWWPKVAPGGVFSGDDYSHTVNPGEGAYGVVEAVNEWVGREGLTLCVTGVGGTDPGLIERHAREEGDRITRWLAGDKRIVINVPAWYVFKP